MTGKKAKMIEALNMARPCIGAMFTEGRMTLEEDDKLGAALEAVANYIEVLEAALKPFANYADDYEGCHDDEALDFITLATLRRARAALES